MQFELMMTQAVGGATTIWLVYTQLYLLVVVIYLAMAGARSWRGVPVSHMDLDHVDSLSLDQISALPPCYLLLIIYYNYEQTGRIRSFKSRHAIDDKRWPNP